MVTVGVVAFVAGFIVSRQWPLRSKKARRRATPKHTNESSESTETDSEDESEDEGIDINSLSLNEVPGEVRMTLIVRQDLKMGKGKAAAQCSHATLALYKKITNPQLEAFNPEMVHRWEYGNGQAKITLQVPDQEGMDTLFAHAIEMGVNAYIVHDAGRTQVAAGSATVLGLGPAPKAVIDEITGELKLY